MPKLSLVRSVRVIKKIKKIKKTDSQAYKLLLEYRLTTWRKSALEAVPGVKNNALSAYKKQLHFTDELVATFKGNKRFGDKLYWVIYITYMSSPQPSDVEEIIFDIAQKCERIPRRTYFWLRSRAIDIMDTRLTESMETELIKKEERYAV